MCPRVRHERVLRIDSVITAEPELRARRSMPRLLRIAKVALTFTVPDVRLRLLAFELPSIEDAAPCHRAMRYHKI